MAKSYWHAAWLALLIAGCAGERDQPVRSGNPPARSNGQTAETQTNSVEELQQQNSEVQRRLAELEAEKKLRDEQEQARLQAEVDAARQEQERLAAEQKRQAAEAERVASAERVRQLNIFVGSLPRKHFDRWTELAGAREAGTLAPDDAQWLAALETVVKKAVAGTPFDDQDLAALRAVDLPYYGTRDGSTLHLKLRAFDGIPNGKNMVLKALDQDAPKLGLDREQIATLGVFLTSYSGLELREKCQLLDYAARCFEENRLMTNRYLERLRDVAAFDDVVAEYERRLADSKQAAIIYQNTANSAAATLKEGLDEFNAAQKSLDEDVPKLRALEAKIEPLAKAERSTSRTRATLEKLTAEAAELRIRIEERLKRIEFLQEQFQFLKDRVAEYQAKANAAAGR